LTSSDERIVAERVVERLEQEMPDADLSVTHYSAPGDVWTISVRLASSRPDEGDTDIDIVIEYFDHISDGRHRYSVENDAVRIDERVDWLVAQCVTMARA